MQYLHCYQRWMVRGLSCGLVCLAFTLWFCKKSTTKRKVKEKKTLLQKEAERTQEELTFLSEFIPQIVELKRGHHQQKEEFKLLEEINKELAENKEKLRLVENEITKSEKEKETDKTERHLQEKQSLLSFQRKLEKRKEELENLHLNMGKQLQHIKDILSRMTERRTKLENNYKVIKLQLQEVENQ